VNPTIIKALFEKRMHTVNQLQALAAVADGREYTAEEKASEERMSNELVELGDKIQKGLDALELEQRSADALERYSRLTQGADPVRGPNNRNEEADGLRSFLRGETRMWEPKISSAVLHNYDLTTRSWNPDVWETRALQESTGGMPLPRTFSGQLYEAYVAAATVLRAKQGTDTLFITSSGEAFDVPRALVHGNATTTAEGGNIATGSVDPTLSFITLNAYKEDQLLQVSRELIDDEGFDIVGYVARAMGRNCGILADTHYVVGSGSGQATGFQPNATVAVTGPVGTTVSLGTQATAGMGSDLLVSLKYSILEQYRANGYWMMNDQSIASVAKLKGSNGEVIWQGGLAPGAPDTILGRPLLSNANMPVMAANAKSIAFGDFNGYAVRIVRGVRFERSDEFAFGTDLVTFKAVLRTDGKLVDTNAIKLFQNSAT
jgi:HK97 family phage major capsid protein